MRKTQGSILGKYCLVCKESDILKAYETFPKATQLNSKNGVKT